MSAHPKDPMPRNYAIGDFAKKAGVSTHFLKFYEEKGILHPKVQSNGYRYYDIRDASLVLECHRMKNMGFSVREIEKGINDCTPQEVGAMLARQENDLQAQLHEQQMHLLGLQNLRAALRLCEQGEWSVRTVPDVWFLPHTLNGEFLPDDRIYDQLPQWLLCQEPAHRRRFTVAHGGHHRRERTGRYGPQRLPHSVRDVDDVQVLLVSGHAPSPFPYAKAIVAHLGRSEKCGGGQKSSAPLLTNT